MPDARADALKKQLTFGQRAAARLVAWLARVWYATLRVQSTARMKDVIRYTETPGIFLLWHNRISVGPFLYKVSKRTRPMHTIISASRDGRFVTRVLNLLGMPAVSGSSSRRGTQAFIELLDILKRGEDIVITPDGPRGPMYCLKPSAAMLARLSGARIVLLNPTITRGWRMKSWDGFYLPKPFSKIVLDAEMLEENLAESFENDEAFSQEIKRRYDAITRDEIPYSGRRGKTP